MWLFSFLLAILTPTPPPPPLFFSFPLFSLFFCHPPSAALSPPLLLTRCAGLAVWDSAQGGRPKNSVPVAAGQPACHAELPSAAGGRARSHLSGREGAQPDSSLGDGRPSTHQHSTQPTCTGTRDFTCACCPVVSDNLVLSWMLHSRASLVDWKFRFSNT